MTEQSMAALEKVSDHNREAARRTHVRPSTGGRNNSDCFFGCDLEQDTFCKRVHKVVYDERGAVVEVHTRG